MSNIDLRLGNVLDVLAQMPSESVHCIVTSPPYWGLRAYGTEPQVWRNGSEPCVDGHEWQSESKTLGRNDANRQGVDGFTGSAGKYGSGETKRVATVDTCTRCGAWRGELGLEPQPEMFVEHIVAVMREARRVLRNDGTLWLNIGDSFAHNGACGGGSPVDHATDGRGDRPTRYRGQDSEAQQRMKYRVPAGLKPKDLVGIPWRVAFALQADGWYLRSDIIWHKPNPMPESVRDRPTKAHEYIFLLAKQPRYFYDADAVREPHATLEHEMRRKDFFDIQDYSQKGDGKAAGVGKIRTGRSRAEDFNPNGRNRRSVWTVTTHPYSGAHFATFPPKLIEPCILAATSERGVCSKCGAPWVRVVEHKRGDRTDARTPKQTNEIYGDNPKSQGLHPPGWRKMQPDSDTFIGWRASCACDAGEPVPATVLDPFNGAGTTGLVALQHGRRYIGIDLKQEYLDMTRARLQGVQMVTA